MPGTDPARQLTEMGATMTDRLSDEVDFQRTLQRRELRLLENFYLTGRAGAVHLSDGGGPLGFDITVALQIDHLIRGLECDGVVETGCHYGDTTEYLGRHYADISVVTCDVDERSVMITQTRCERLPNVAVLLGDSAELLPRMVHRMERPLLLLDAHWYDPWPLPVELAIAASLPEAVVCVDDFYIDHPRFGFDEYGMRCDAELVAQYMPDRERMFVGNPLARYPMPCLQVGRRAGTGYVAVGLDDDVLATSRMFCAVNLSSPIKLPTWDS